MSERLNVLRDGSGELKAARVNLTQVNVVLAITGRPCVIAMPDDISDAECVEMIEALYQAISHVRAQRVSSRLIIPRPT